MATNTNKPAPNKGVVTEHRKPDLTQDAALKYIENGGSTKQSSTITVKNSSPPPPNPNKGGKQS